MKVLVFIVSLVLEVIWATLNKDGVFLKPPACGNGRVLEDFGIRILNVTSQMECAAMCLRNLECSSVNVGRMTHELWSCELNNNRIRKRCSELTEKPNYEYFEQDKFVYPRTCKDLRDNDESAPSGVYYIKLNEASEPFQVYCDMDTAGGGWTLVYSYRFVDLEQGSGPARVSVWPTWNMESHTPKSTVVPLSDTEEGAMEFNLWKEMGAEFWTTSTITNWYQCSPGHFMRRGSLTEWRDGSLLCSIAKVQVPEKGCHDVAPVWITLTNPDGPLLDGPDPDGHMVFYEGSSDRRYPTHDPCGRNSFGDETSISDYPRGAIYVR